MSDHWAITPPCSPNTSKNEDGTKNNDLDSGNAVLFADNWSSRMFCCMGEPQNSIISFHEESYLKNNELSIFCSNENRSVIFLEDFGPISLFGFKFDKGSALLKDADSLFKMAKYSYMQLDVAAKANVSSLGTNFTCKKFTNCSKQREEIVKFLIYIRNFVQRVDSNSKFYWVAENLFDKLNNELSKLRALCGSVDNLPDYVINYSANIAGNRNTQPSYHLFHCQLDLKWLHLTLLYQLILFKRRFEDEKCSEEYGTPLNFRTLDNYIEHLVSDLIAIAVKRFQRIPINEIALKSLFTCTCIRELWKLLQLSVSYLHSCKYVSNFWDFINRICDKILKEDSADCASLKIHHRPIFVVWLLKHLIKLSSSDEKLDLKSNYGLLENAITKSINLEPAENDLRVFLHLIESILNSEWEMRTDPLVLFWEYFNKKLNSLFYIPGSAIGGLAVISESASGLLNQLRNKIEVEQSAVDKSTNSFHLFLRLLGRSLRKWSDNPRFWNQLKGRIFSKFSSVKLSALNEVGLFHFISLFLTLAIATDLNEVSKKLQHFLNMLIKERLDEARSKLVWKAHISLILLFAESNQDISSVSTPILDLVEETVQQPSCSSLMRVFIDGFQDLINSTNNLELGQYTFIGKWIYYYLSQCNESDSSRFLATMSLLISNLNSLMSAQLPVSQDNQMILLHGALWEQLVPYLRKMMCFTSTLSNVGPDGPDIAATLTTIGLKSCFSQSVKNQAVDLLTFFISHDSVDVRLLCRYLGQVSRSMHLHSLNNLSITLIKGWLRCVILLSNDVEADEDLSTFTKFIVTLPELQKLFSETQVNLNSHSDYFENFLIAVQLKYSSLPDYHSKTKFTNQVGSYFANIERWLSHLLKVCKSEILAMNIYRNIGQMFFKIPEMLYTKSRPNSLLQSFLDLLLLPLQIRNPQSKLNSNFSEAIKETFYLFVRGLFKLDPENDPYIYRSIKELLTLYVPRLVVLKGTGIQFSLAKCFDFSDGFELMSKSITEILCNAFIKKRAKTPHQFAYHALVFFNNLIRSRRNNDAVVKSFIKNALERICDVVMFCDHNNPCKKVANDVLQFTLDLHILRNESDIGDDLMEVLSKLCHEHLAFSSNALFDLFEKIVTVAPDLVTRFLPQLTEQIKEVERKRGVGFDRSLRKGLEQITEALKNIRNNHNSNAFL